jgi:multidrug resistance protein, MATE family
VHLAWPTLIGQLAVMANGLIDTLMAGRLSPTDLAAVGLASSFQFTVYVTLNGIIMGISPIIGQHFGATRFTAIGKTAQQGFWLAIGLSILGVVFLLLNPLWLALTQAPASVSSIASDYLNWSATGILAALLFRVFYATSAAVNLPRVVMTIQLLMLAFKIPLNWLFMYGTDWGVKPMGGAGCGLATAVLAWIGLGAAFFVIRRDSRYAKFGFRFWQPIDKKAMAGLLRLGLPMGLSYGIEISSFTLIAMLVAHKGVDVAAAHQVCSNLLGVAYMVPLALSSAISNLVAQKIGARQWLAAKSTGVSGIVLVISLALLVAGCFGLFANQLAGLYLGQGATNALVASNAAGLIRILAIFIVFDAAQTVLAFILRAYKVASVPSIIYAISLWGVGIGGGWSLTSWVAPSWSAGAAGYWWAGTGGVMVAAFAFVFLLKRQWARSLNPALNPALSPDVSPKIHV